MKYPVTCKVAGVPAEGYPRMMSLEEAMQPGQFPSQSVVDVIGVGGVRVAYKDPGQAGLTVGPRAS